MSNAIPLKCDCGKVTGEARPRLRVVCYCKWCQAYARHLGHPELLDDAGGTEILQVAPAHLKLDLDGQPLGCVRLTTKGPLRWFTGCCRTPVANTLTSRALPFLMMPHLLVDRARLADSALPPVAGRVEAKAATRDVPGAHAGTPLGLAARVMANVARMKLSGQNRPSPLIDAAGRWVTEATVLDGAARKALFAS